ncbi:MAG: ATP-binding cassette domain-containing protein [Anaerolineaceae bacterium]|nr:ATP-binding cassette domain-containing protein [Anaerolineaceae bacterium]
MPNHNELSIKTDHLSKHFGHLVAVDSLAIEVKRGEIFGLVGPDGAGKTTTLRMLATILEPTSGSATVAGLDLHRDAEPIKARIGYMAQQFTLYGDLTVLENITFLADIYGVRGQVRRERIERLLNFARLTEFVQRRAGLLSGGMKKKLGLACAMVHAPDILFLDEPTTGVDPVSRREFWDILADLHTTGTTIVVNTPYMDEAERCSQVGLMYQGRLVEYGSPNQLKALLPGQLLEFKPVVAADAGEETPHGVGLLHHAQSILTPLPGVLEVQSMGDLLHVFVDNVAERQPQLAAALAGQHISMSGARQISPRMEDAFISLITKLETEATP